MTQKFMTSPKQLRNTIEPTQNIRILLSILVTSKYSGKVSQDNLKTYQHPAMWICSHCHACQGKVGHPTIYYIRGRDPTSFAQQPCSSCRILPFKSGEKWTQVLTPQYYSLRILPPTYISLKPWHSNLVKLPKFDVLSPGEKVNLWHLLIHLCIFNWFF